jgi:hypothetical protein
LTKTEGRKEGISNSLNESSHVEGHSFGQFSLKLFISESKETNGGKIISSLFSSISDLLSPLLKGPFFFGFSSAFKTSEVNLLKNEKKTKKKKKTSVQ